MLRTVLCYPLPQKWGFLWKPALVLLLLMPCLLLFQADAKDRLDPKKPYTFYLTDQRICQQCYWEIINPTHVKLTNEKGISGLYEVGEVLSVDNKPRIRKLLLKSLEGLGLRGQVIVPEAFPPVYP